MNIAPALLLPLLLAASAAEPAPAAPPKPGDEALTEEQKVLYAVGAIIGQQADSLRLQPQELPSVIQGLEDVVLHRKPKVVLPDYGPKAEGLIHDRVTKTFLERAAAQPGVKKTESGLVLKVLKEGDGPSPKAADKVKVHYRGTLLDGREFDSSYKRGEPIEFPLNGVIKCWTEGLQLMKVGEKAQLVCPPDIAYGRRGSPPDIPPDSALVFDVELLGIGK